MEPRSYCLQVSACRLVGILFWGCFSCRSEEGVNFEFDFEEAKWHPTLNTDFKTGSRHLAQLGFSLPLKQGDDSLFFFDFRGWIDDDHNDEYNVGFAYRKLLDDRIVGFYGYFDRHFTQYSGNRFDQITLGTEILGECWDHRFNAYIPTDFGGQGTETGNLSIIANRIYISGLEERAYWGFDYETGKLIRCFGKNQNELRVYGGGFFFQNDAVGYETIAGPRLRLEMRLFDVEMLGEGSRITLNSQVQWDQVRDTQAFAGVGFQIPLGKWSSRGTLRGDSPFGPGCGYACLSPMERRMYDPIVRDVDVVTSTSGQELVNDAEDDLLFVANTDFDLDEQIANAGTDGTVVVDGTISTPGSHNLLDGQRLAGGDSVQTVIGTTTGRRITTRLPGRRGTLNSTNSLNPVVVVTDNNIVDSLHINGGLVGILGGVAPGTPLSNVTIINNTIAGALDNGGGLGDEEGSGIALVGIFDGSILNNTLLDNERNGIFVWRNNGVISNNQTRGNEDDGIDIWTANNGTISGNTSIMDGDESIEVKARNNGTISNNTSSMAGDNGIQVGGANFGSVTGNYVSGAGDDGFDFSFNDGIISGNTSVMNVEDGFDLDNPNRETGVISNNFASQNGENGFNMTANRGTLSGNTSTLNTGSGFELGINRGTMSGNVANFNTLDGFRSSNATFFFNIRNEDPGIFNNNTANSNTGAGFRVNNEPPTPGTSSGNTGANNGAVNSGNAVP